MWEQAQTLPCSNGSGSYLVAQSPVRWPELAVMWVAGSRSFPVHPKNPSHGVSAGVSALAASLCCPNTVPPPHSTPCSMVLLAPVFSWICCKVSLSTEGFCSNAFSIHLYMCSHTDLHLLCPVKKKRFISSPCG